LNAGLGDTPTVVLTDDLRSDTIAALVRAGARAVLPRSIPQADLESALETVARGFLVIAQAHASSASDALTTREREVLDLLARGYANKRIASVLSLSDHTAKFHVAAILAKLGASTRTEAVAIAARRGLVML
jgi:DNA-binding NarL/FixJ family response regulator